LDVDSPGLKAKKVIKKLAAHRLHTLDKALVQQNGIIIIINVNEIWSSSHSVYSQLTVLVFWSLWTLLVASAERLNVHINHNFKEPCRCSNLRRLLIHICCCINALDRVHNAYYFVATARIMPPYSMIRLYNNESRIICFKIHVKMWYLDNTFSLRRRKSNSAKL